MNTESLFSNHLLPIKTRTPQLHFTDFDFAITGILLFAFALFVWIYTFNRKRLNQIVKAFYINRYANQLSREEVFLGNRMSTFLSLLFIISVTLFLKQTFQYYNLFQHQTSYMLFTKIAIGLFMIYALKLTVVKLLGHIFQFQKSTSDYTMSIFLFCNTLGLFMLPIVICMMFMETISPLVFIYGGAGLFLAFIVIRLVRGVMIGLNNVRFSKFYLFLYICALEIVPFIIMAKMFMIKIK